MTAKTFSQTPLGRLQRRLHRGVTRLKAIRLRQRTVAELQALTPRQLIDTGLSPADIERVANEATMRRLRQLYGG